MAGLIDVFLKALMSESFSDAFAVPSMNALIRPMPGRIVATIGIITDVRVVHSKHIMINNQKGSP